MTTTLKKEHRVLAQELSETFFVGCRNGFPRSSSDMSYGIAAILKMFEVKRRPIAIDVYASEEELVAEERAYPAARGDSVESLGKYGYKMTIEK